MRAIEFSGQSPVGFADGSSDGGRVCGDCGCEETPAGDAWFGCLVRGRGKEGVISLRAKDRKDVAITD